MSAAATGLISPKTAPWVALIWRSCIDDMAIGLMPFRRTTGVLAGWICGSEQGVRQGGPRRFQICSPGDARQRALWWCRFTAECSLQSWTSNTPPALLGRVRQSALGRNLARAERFALQFGQDTSSLR